MADMKKTRAILQIIGAGSFLVTSAFGFAEALYYIMREFSLVGKLLMIMGLSSLLITIGILMFFVIKGSLDALWDGSTTED